MIYGAIACLGILLALFLLLLRAQAKAHKQGREEKENEERKEILGDVKKANSAAADSSHDDKLREKYGRK